MAGINVILVILVRLGPGLACTLTHTTHTPGCHFYVKTRSANAQGVVGWGGCVRRRSWFIFATIRHTMCSMLANMVSFFTTLGHSVL